MSKANPLSQPKQIKVTRHQAQEIYNCLIGYAIANEQQASVTSLPSFIAGWRSASQKQVIEVMRSHDTAVQSLVNEYHLLNDSYAEFAEQREQVTMTTDADGNSVPVGTGVFTSVKENGLYKISDETKAKEYKEALDLFNFEEKRKKIDEELYDLTIYRIKAEEMMKVKSAVSYEGRVMGDDGKPVSTTMFPDYSIMYELIYG